MTTRISHQKTQAVLRRLQDWRRERADRDAVPAYVVAPNATLTEIARRRPADPGELVEIKGFGPTRVEKYGDEILAILRRVDHPSRLERSAGHRVILSRRRRISSSTHGRSVSRDFVPQNAAKFEYSSQHSAPMLDSAPLRRATRSSRRHGGGWGPVASPVFKTV